MKTNEPSNNSMGPVVILLGLLVAAAVGSPLSIVVGAAVLVIGGALTALEQ